jgi:uncharacterized membrane protein
MDFIDILKIIGIAASPISELRGAIPIAVGVYDFPWYYAFIFGIIGNLIPVPFILLFLDYIIPVLCKIPLLDRLVQWFLARTRRRGKIVERFERIGLALFVAIPLPITGAWTGSILAVLLGLKFRQSFLSIACGVIIAGIIVTSATVLGWAVADVLTKPVE